MASFLLNADRSIVSSTRSLREAAKAGQVSIVRLLLDMGMDVSAADNETKDTALHEAVRYLKVGVSEVLLGYGADPYQPNADGETPHGLLEAYSDSHMRTEILKKMEECKEKEVIVPAIVLDERRARMAQQLTGQDEANEYKTGQKAHPPLRCFDQWTKDTKEYCSGFTGDAGPSNIINVETHLEWVAPGTGSQWVVVDFGSPYAITALEVIGQPGRAMPKDLQLEVGDSLHGPWRVIKAFLSSAAEGGGEPTEGGKPFAQ